MRFQNRLLVSVTKLEPIFFLWEDGFGEKPEAEGANSAY
jgi:hypothetical protein